MRIRVLTPDGVVEVDLPDDRERSTVGRYWNAISDYTRNGRTDRLSEFESVEVGDGLRFETGPDAIDEFWFSGELDFLDVYTS